ncbi:MAG TPA: hypothetical protein VFB38_15660 [Chthonomonadaceae bacterium]|nr:hypothetical protein [Chthonomonadaceae bacterium]
MSIPYSTHHYAFHGLAFQIRSNDASVLAALQRRLRHFRILREPLAELCFVLERVSQESDLPITKPPGPLRPVYDLKMGEVVYSATADQLYIRYGDNVRCVCDPEKGRTHIAFRPYREQEVWLVSHPLFTLPLLELCKRHQRYSLHAAGLCLQNKGILLPGTSGAGKSTLTLALLRAGFDFLGDDQIFLSQDSGGIRMLAFPDEVDITEETAGFFPELTSQRRCRRPVGWPKHPLLVEEVYDVKFVRECRPAVVVFPQISAKQASLLKRMSPGEALLELAPNILLTERCSCQSHLDILAELVRTTPCYRLETGRDFDTTPRLLADLVA